jgi:hypothetical protein
MIVKDANTYNIQFNNGQPLSIDILSFEKYKEGRLGRVIKSFAKTFSDRWL